MTWISRLDDIFFVPGTDIYQDWWAITKIVALVVIGLAVIITAIWAEGFRHK
jgi:hypothetical protein